jgi:hypothetical protein
VCVAVVGSTTAAVFEAYVEQALASTLRPGQVVVQVVVMDNLEAHNGERVRKLIQGRSCEVLYLPPYSPELNPIEEAFSKVKGVSPAPNQREDAAGPCRGDGKGAGRGDGPRRPKVLRALRLPASGPTFMTDAVRGFLARDEFYKIPFLEECFLLVARSNPNPSYTIPLDLSCSFLRLRLW